MAAAHLGAAAGLLLALPLVEHVPLYYRNRFRKDAEDRYPIKINVRVPPPGEL
jgi:hypothetical protein